MIPFDVIQAPLDPGTHALIEANAGTGKTYNIQHLYLRLILEKGYEPSQILVVTFTEAATAELRERIRANLAAALKCMESDNPNATTSDEILRNILKQARQICGNVELISRAQLALAAFDEAAISTIHGFCHRALHRHAFDSGTSFDCELQPDLSGLVSECITDFYRKETQAPPAAPISLKELKEHAKITLRHTGELIFDPPAKLDEEALWQDFIKVLTATSLPGRNSKFKIMLANLQHLANKGRLQLKDSVWQDSSLTDSTAQNNAPEFVKALRALKEARVINLLARLREYLNDDKYGIEARKRRINTIGYDDLLKQMREALPDAECDLARELRATCPAALVDEFQDTDPVQYHIFHTIFVHPDSLLYMIGDPKQAIYAFRGGDIYAYMAAREQVSSNLFFLHKNYRSASELLKAINYLFGPDHAFADQSLAYEPSLSGKEPKQRLLQSDNKLAAPFKVCWFTGDSKGAPVAKSNLTTHITHYCTVRIAEMLADNTLSINSEGLPKRRLKPSDFAVLTTTNDQARKTQRSLLNHSIPAVIYNADDVFDSPEALELWHILSAMDDPGNPRKIKAALLTPWCGRTYNNLIEPDSDSTPFAQHCANFANARQLWQDSGILMALSTLLASYNSYRNIAQQPADCERKLTNLRHLTELAHQAEGSTSRSPEALLQWLTENISRNNDKSEEYEERMESDGEAVTVMTIHKSKGLEFPIVLVPFLCCKESLPDKVRNSYWTVHNTENSRTRLTLPLTSSARESFLAKLRQERLAEDLRLLYVAVTRATNYCAIIMGNIKGRGKGNGMESAANYLVQIHRNPQLKPEQFIQTPPLAESQSPFTTIPRIERITTTDVALEEMARAEVIAYKPETDALTTIKPLEKPTPPDNWAVMSYSGMTQHTYATPAHLKQAAGSDEISDTDAPPTTTHDHLPGGVGTGLCLHAILETLPFEEVKPSWVPNSQTCAWIESLAARYGLLPDTTREIKKIHDRIREIISNALNKEFRNIPDTFTLNTITPANLSREWEFYLPVSQKIHLAPFQQLGLSFKEGSGKQYGFLTGSIDLLVRSGERYYFMDWKSDTLESYATASLSRTMVERNYLFQAIVYGVALHRWLETSLGHNYNFNLNFGGGYYCFLRDMTSDNGVFRFQPGLKQILQWSDLLIGKRA